MNIEKHDQEISTELMDLLLKADPDKEAVLSYIRNSEVIVSKDNEKFAGVAVLIKSKDVYEIKNISVHDDYRGKGIAKAMINEAMRLAKKSGAKVIEVGTGNSSLSQLEFYQKCGFRMYKIVPGYFEDYPEPIVENGIRCLDMVLLRAKL